MKNLRKKAQSVKKTQPTQLSMKSSNPLLVPCCSLRFNKDIKKRIKSKPAIARRENINKILFCQPPEQVLIIKPSISFMNRRQHTQSQIKYTSKSKRCDNNSFSKYSTIYSNNKGVTGRETMKMRLSVHETESQYNLTKQLSKSKLKTQQQNMSTKTIKPLSSFLQTILQRPPLFKNNYLADHLQILKNLSYAPQQQDKTRKILFHKKKKKHTFQIERWSIESSQQIN